MVGDRRRRLPTGLRVPPSNFLATGYLKGISKLISGSTDCNVRDMGGFTEDAPTPFAVRISMPDVLALMRQSWVYERFCQTKCGSRTVVVLRSKHSRGKDKLRVTWENSGSLDYTKAQVCKNGGGGGHVLYVYLSRRRAYVSVAFVGCRPSVGQLLYGGRLTDDTNGVLVGRKQPASVLPVII